MVLQERSTSPSPEKQIEQQTAVRGTSPNNNVVAADVSLHDQNGNPYTVTNPLPIFISQETPTGNVETGHNYYSEVSSVASNTETSVLIYTVPSGFKYVLVRVTFDGENIAKYILYIDGEIIEKKHTYHGSSLYGEFDFFVDQSRGVVYPAGTKFELKVTHYRPMLADFSARLQGISVQL